MRNRIGTVAVALVVLLLGVGLAYGLNEITDLQDQYAESRSDRTDLREKLRQQEAAAAALSEQLRILGERPVVEPSDPPEPGQIIPIPGPKGDRGLSCIEEIGLRPCRGDQGRAGPEGTTGEPGAPGTPGAPGAQGEQGPQGERGPQGEQGPAGPAGPEGRGIADAQCGADGRWTVTYTDGTTSDGGICRIDPGSPGGKP